MRIFFIPDNIPSAAYVYHVICNILHRFNWLYWFVIFESCFYRSCFSADQARVKSSVHRGLYQIHSWIWILERGCRLDKQKKIHNTRSCHFSTTNFTTWQSQSQHQQQTSNNDKRHRSFSGKSNKRRKCHHKVNASSYYNALWTTDACISIPCRLVHCL